MISKLEHSCLVVFSLKRMFCIVPQVNISVSKLWKYVRMLVKRRKYNPFSYNYPTGITVDFIHTKKTMLIPTTSFVSASRCTTDVAEIAKICRVTTCRCGAAIYSIEMQVCM